MFRFSQSNTSKLTLLPVDIKKNILFNYLDEAALAKLATSNSLFKSEAEKLVSWKNRLIENGYDEDLINQLQNTGLNLNYKKLYRTLIKINYDQRIQVKEIWELLCLSGEKEAIRYAIQRGLQPTHVNNKGENALLCVARSGNVEGIKFLLEEKYSAKSTSHNGMNILLLAAFSGSVAAMKYAHKTLKINPHSVTQDGINALHLAAFSGNPEAIDYAIKSLKIDKKSLTHAGETLLHFAAMSGSCAAVKHAIKILKLDTGELKNDKTHVKNHLTKNHENIFHIAAQYGHVELMKTATQQYGIDIKSVNKEQDNALHLATSRGQIGAIKFLIEECKLDPASVTKEDSNLLHLVANSANPAAAKYAATLNKQYKLNLYLEKRNNCNHDAFWFAEQSSNPKKMKKALLKLFPKTNPFPRSIGMTP